MNEEEQDKKQPPRNQPRTETPPTAALVQTPSSDGSLFHPNAVKTSAERDSPSTVMIPSAWNEQEEEVPAALAPPEVERLSLLLNLFHKKSETEAIMAFLESLGVSTLDDLKFLQESDFEEASTAKISSVLRRKLLLLSKFLQQGGSFSDEDIRSMNDVLRFLEPKKERPEEDTVVKLDVGGHCFTTSRDTLCRVTDSTLAAMFSGRHQHPARIRPDGSFFIDRDGTHFHHILNFLRVGAVVTLPTDAAGKQALALEADYCGLNDLIRAIQEPEVDPTDFLSDEMVAIRRDEERFRDMFVEDSVATRSNPHMGLESLFSPDHGPDLPLRYEPHFDTESLCMNSLRESAPPGTPVTVTSLDEFHTNFNRVHENVLHRIGDILLDSPVVIAGGSVLQALTGTQGLRTADWWGAKSDIDLFVHSETVEVATQIARRIFYALAVDNERWVVLRSRGVITMHRASDVPDLPGGAVVQKIQIILRLYDSPSEVLFGFDCDCCGCCYDGRHVWVTPRCLHALRTGVNVVNSIHAWPNKASYELRLAKYALRGYAVAIPGLDWKRIDLPRIVQTPLDELKGLARLFKIAFSMEMKVNGTPPEPISRIPALREELKRTYTDDEFLVHGMGGYFDGRRYEVIIFRAYVETDLNDEPMGCSWHDNYSFPLSQETRDEGWEEIESASSPRGLPLQLSDAWDQEKRSREYLNARLETFARDNTYYGQAYLLRDD